MAPADDRDDREVEPTRASGHQAAGFGLEPGSTFAGTAGRELTTTGRFVGHGRLRGAEQIAGEAVDGRADVYSLACVAFHALRGEPPFRRDTPIATMFAHANAPRLSERAPGLPSALDDALGRRMAQRPDAPVTRESASRRSPAGGLGRDGAHTLVPMILCLGEALVDLICERRVASEDDVDSFRPHFGGALANVAVAARRAGASSGLAGGTGDDEWGRWLAGRLEREGVDLRFFSLLAGESTPVAFATFDLDGEPSFRIYGGIGAAVESIEPRLAEAIDAASALVFTSTTLAAPQEARITRRARELALERDVRVCLDANIRPNRWGGDARPAVEAARELVPGSFLVKANRDEAIAIAGVDDPRRAAAEIAAMGAELAVVTLGGEGAVTSGASEVELPALDVEVASSLGAGDAFMGTLVAGLATRDWDPRRAPEALGPALAAAADACTRWSALPERRSGYRGPP
ncbi:MAG TPA: PfkB family carbohydrate kinase [Solirubrobacterales bacterium]|nr:PfkB family carbohydrate kinase [Solirubrobacterales bacterium]